MNVVIGNTSQQSYFYPSDYIKISSREIDLDWLSKNYFDSVYITFAEQKIYDENVDFMTPNFNFTIQILNVLIEKSKKIVVFGTCELWNNCIGTIHTNTPFNYSFSKYCESKFSLINRISQLKIEDPIWNKVKVIHPFYFNSSYRSDYFLFGKIFKSIIERTKIETGSLDFYRDMVHTRFFVEKTISSEDDLMIGSGRLFNVRDFIYDLYLEFNMIPENYIAVNQKFKINEKFIRPFVEWNYTYSDLLIDTINDLKNKI